MSPEIHRCELLVIGSGVAGLSVALGIARNRPETRIVLLAKGKAVETNTSLAQGGIAASTGADDHPETHAQDTLRVGGAEADPEIVRMVTGEAPERIEELLEEGVPFDRDERGNLALGQEGGHSKERILHIGDRTGEVLHRTLMEKLRECPNVHLKEEHFALDLIVERGECGGAYTVDQGKGKLIAYISSQSVLATGGAGQLYRWTSNSPIATGDGYAMAQRAGLPLRDMGKVQFHPTAFATRSDERAFLISEALRGEGARLMNAEGECFARAYHPDGELAPRALLSKAITEEMERTGAEHVFLDATHFSSEGFRKRFPSIHAYLKQGGIDPSRDPIPVVPAAHYFCGGVPVDRFAWTGMPGLYACGEVTRTGLHGKDRTASNSLLEALVFAERVRLGLMNEAWPRKEPALEGGLYRSSPSQKELAALSSLRCQLRDLMSEKVGIRSSEGKLKVADEELNELQKAVQELREERCGPLLMETWNMLQVALSVVKGRLATQG